MSEDSSKSPNRLPLDPPSLISPTGRYVDSNEDDDDDFSADDSGSGSFSSGSTESGSESDSSEEDMPDLYVRRHRESESHAQAVAKSRRAASRQRAKADSRRLRRARKNTRNAKGKRRRAAERSVDVADGVVPSGVAAALSRLDLIGLLGLAEAEVQDESSSSGDSCDCECHSSVCLLSSFDSSESNSPIVWDFDSHSGSLNLNKRMCLITRCSSSASHALRLHGRCCLAFFLATLLQKWKDGESVSESLSVPSTESEKFDETGGAGAFPCPVEACRGVIVDVRNDLTGECLVLGGTVARSEAAVDVESGVACASPSEGVLKGERSSRSRREKRRGQTRTAVGETPTVQSRLSVLSDHRERQMQKRSNLRDMERLERVRRGQDGGGRGRGRGRQRNLKKMSKTRERQERKERRRRAREARRSANREALPPTGVDSDPDEEEAENEGGGGGEEEGEIRVTFLSLGGDVALQRMQKRLEGLRLSRLRAQLLRHKIPILVEESEESGFENVAPRSASSSADEEGRISLKQPESEPIPLFAEEDPKSVGYVVSLREKHGILRTLAGRVLNFPLYSVAVPTLGSSSGNIASVVRFWLKPGDKVAFELDGDCARNVALIERPSEEQRRRKVRTRLIQTFVADQSSRFEGIVCEIVRQEGVEDVDLMFVAVGGEKVVQASIPKAPIDLFNVGDVVVFGLIPEKSEYLLASNVSIKSLTS